MLGALTARNSCRRLAVSKAKSEQAKRFIEAAREAGCSEDEAEIRETVKRLAPVKPEKRKAEK